MTLAFDYAAHSDVGLLREGNEDSGYAGPHLLVVADGMGGAAAGEVASSVAVAALSKLDDDELGGDLLAALAHRFGRAHDQLHGMVLAEPALKGMGTTLTAALRAGGRLALLHVGDSRAYLLRGDRLERITQDHTLVQSLVDAGRLTVEEAQLHPQRSILTRALDGMTPIEPDLSIREVHAGDRLLLCSDGLSGVVAQETIAETLQQHPHPEDACQALVELALRGGGPDNITCVVADVVDVPDTTDLAATPAVVGAVSVTKDSRRLGLPDTPAGRAARLSRDYDEPFEGVSRRKRRRTLLLTALGTLVAGLVVGAVIGWYAWAQQQYYVGVDDAYVAVYRGPAQPLFGLQISDVVERTDVAAATLPEFEQEQLASTIPARSRDDADQIVMRLRAEAEECLQKRPPSGCPESP